MELKVTKMDFPDLLPMRHRSSGMHVSNVIKDLALRHGLLTVKPKPGQKPDETVLSSSYAQLGQALEWATIQRFKRHYNKEAKAKGLPEPYFTPGEMCLHGLYAHPDLVFRNSKLERVHEIKLAWMSSANDPRGPKFERYWWQLKGYCRMRETCYGRLHVCFVNGDYKDREPEYWQYDATFTSAELGENWRMLRQHAEYMRSKGNFGETY